MKKSVITSVLAVLTALTTIAGAQNYPKEYLGLPGDNLNLYAVLDLFRNSPTLEAFERSLNDRDSRINNLDLNRDWRVDYIAVSDYRDGRVHNIVLRAVLGRNEYQDVAVIIVERLNKKKVVIQVIGDELLYGRNYIIEPFYARKHKVRYDYSPVYYGGVTYINNYYYDIWEWPVVIHLYSPYYTGWSSSWYWGYYPAWYEPWRPWYWDYYYGYHSGWHNHYHNYYYHSDRYRYDRYNDYYYHSVRQESPQVQRRIAESTYRQTYSRPEQRAEGAELARRTREAVSRDTRSQEVRSSDIRSREVRSSDTRSSDTRSQAPANAGTRRQEAPRAVSSTVPSEERRTTAGTTGRSAAETEAARRAPATVKSSESEATEAREAQAREARAREAQAREAQVREATQRANEQRAAEVRAEQQRAAEQRANELRAAEQRVNEQREAQAREARAREAQARESQVRESQAREAQARETERKSAEARENEKRTSETRTAQQKTLESGSGRPVRK